MGKITVLVVTDDPRRLAYLRKTVDDKINILGAYNDDEAEKIIKNIPGINIVSIDVNVTSPGGKIDPQSFLRCIVSSSLERVPITISIFDEFFLMKRAMMPGFELKCMWDELPQMLLEITDLIDLIW